MSRVRSLFDSGAVVVLRGAPGVGKTAAWQTYLDDAKADVVWRVQCFEAERAWGLTVLADLFSVVPPERLQTLPAIQRHAVDAVLLRSDTPPHAADMRLLAETTTSILRLLAERRRRPVIGIDDLQWCDPTSFGALRFAVRHASLSIATLATRRPDSDRCFTDESVIDVPPLPRDSTRVLIRANGAGLSESVVQDITDISAGNPLYALELTRASPRNARAVSVPGSLKTLLAHRFDPLPQPCREVLLDLAVSGSLADDDDRLPPAYTADIVMSDGRLARFTHPLLAEVTLGLASPSAITSAHHRAATRCDDVVDQARHLAAATRGSDKAIADLLDDAAQTAARRGDTLGARDLARSALNASPAGHRPVHRLIALARLEAGAGGGPEACVLAEEILHEATSDADRFIALMILADNPPASAALAHAERAATLPDITAQSRLEATALRAKVLYQCGRFEEALRLLGAALAETRDPEPARAALTANLLMMQRLTGRRPSEQALQTCVELDRAGELEPSGSALEIAGVLRLLDDQHNDARGLFTEIATGFSTRGYNGSTYQQLMAGLELRVGNLRAARDFAEKVLAAGEALQPSDIAQYSLIATWQGDPDRNAYRDRIRVEPTMDTLGFTAYTTLTYADALDAHLHGDDATAWQILSRLTEDLEHVGIREPSRVPVLPLAIEAAVKVRAMPDARRLLVRLQDQGAALQSKWAAAAVLHARGHIAAGSNDPATALECFESATTEYSQLGLALDSARAMFASGAIRRRLGQRRDARRQLTDCEHRFDELGAASLRRLALIELQRVGGRQPTPHGTLSSAEEHVAQLAETGMKNAEIAQRLSISIKTVENHLSHIYAKLGVRNKAELGQARRELS